MKRFSIFAFICILALTFTACSESTGNTNTSATKSANPSFELAQSSSNTSTSASGARNNDARAEKISLEQADKSLSAPAPSERKVIRNANLILETPATEDAGRKISQIVESKGGFVVSSDTQARNNTNGATGVSTVTLIVRVPAAQFEQTVDEIRKTSARVVQEKVSGQDVTEEFIDLEARIKTKKALEAQFLEIMKSSRTVTDALEVQRQLAEVRGEIEQVEGRRKFLESQTSLSTINVTLNPPAAFAASSNGFFYQLGRAFSNGIDAALNVVLFLVTATLALLPLILLLGIPFWLIIRYLRKRIYRAKLAQQLAKED